MIEPGEKMIVVVMVLAIILLGLAAFLFYLERRLKKTEKKLDELESAAQQKNTPDSNEAF
jgi:CcmD family protein